MEAHSVNVYSGYHSITVYTFKNSITIFFLAVIAHLPFIHLFKSLNFTRTMMSCVIFTQIRFAIIIMM